MEYYVNKLHSGTLEYAHPVHCDGGCHCPPDEKNRLYIGAASLAEAVKIARGHYATARACKYCDTDTPKLGVGVT